MFPIVLCFQFLFPSSVNRFVVTHISSFPWASAFCARSRFPFSALLTCAKKQKPKSKCKFCWWRFHCGSQSSELCPSSSASPHTIWFSLLLKHRVRFICFYNLYSVPLCERLPPNCCHQSYNKQYARGVTKELFVICCFNGQTFRQIFRLHLVCINNLLIYHIGSTCWRF